MEPPASGRDANKRLVSGDDATVSAGPTVGAPTVGAGASVSAGSRDAVAEGTKLDRYIVLRRIGAGGMGTVYAAFDPRLDRNVALKLIKAGTGVSGADSLLKEARALASLNHPNVVSAFDAGSVGDSIFVTMELIDGPTLEEWMKAEHPLRDKLALLIGAGRGLVAAHNAGVIHRDFKPSNVMVDTGGRARVMDFGVAVRREPTTLEDSDAVDRVRIVGTPRFIAPEQYLGEGASPLSDQYAFCVTAYWSLVQRFPRADSTTSLEAMLEAISDPPEPITDRTIPKAVRAAILRGLASDPAERWPTLEELLDELQRALAPRRTAWVVAAVGAVAATALVAVAMRPEPERPCPTVEAKLEEMYPRRRAASSRARSSRLTLDTEAPPCRMRRARWSATRARGRRAMSTPAKTPRFAKSSRPE